MNMTKHARDRVQQRGVPGEVVEWLVRHGQRAYDHHGAVIYYFNDRSRHRLAERYGTARVARLGRKLNAYLVSSGNEILTVGYRDKRIIRH